VDDGHAKEKVTRRKGFAPEVLLAQVRNTAAWALEGEATGWRHALIEAATFADWRERDALVPYLRVMLSAHFASVATLVPTDVDAHIRFHLWQEIDSKDEMERAVAVVDEAASWDPRAVSARVVEVGDLAVHGHAGEWLAVRAGALGRALTIGADDAAERLIEAIRAEIEHEANAFAVARAGNDATLALRVATTLAHNGGDLSRVVEAYPKSTPRRDEMVDRFVRLGHEGTARFGGEHLLAGRINKALMATENHRFLPLREARALRTSRNLIVPIAPFLDAWGDRIATEPLDDKPRAEIVSVLLGAHEAAPTLASYARALAGIERTAKGGLDRIAAGLPSRTRKLLASPPLREAVRTSEERFVARMTSAYRNALR
jgi:hypothetical protein